LRDLKLKKSKILLQRFTIILPIFIQKLFLMDHEFNKSAECNYKNIHYKQFIHNNSELSTTKSTILNQRQVFFTIGENAIIQSFEIKRLYHRHSRPDRESHPIKSNDLDKLKDER